MRSCRIAAFMPMYSRIYLLFCAQQCFCAKMKHINLSYQTFWSCKSSTNQMYVPCGCLFPDEAFFFPGIAWTWYANIQGMNTTRNTFKVCGFSPVINKTLIRIITLTIGIYYPCELQLLQWKSDGLSLYLHSNTLTTIGNQLALCCRLQVSNRPPFRAAVEALH